MFLNFKNLNEKTKERYYLLYKLGQINYDLLSCVNIIKNSKSISNEISLDLYGSKQLYIHINEALKYYNKNLKLYEKYIDKTIINSEIYSVITNEINFSNKNTNNNVFIKSFRDNSVHYKEDENYQYMDEFYKYANELSSYFPEAENDFPPPYEIEIISMMINLNIFTDGKNKTCQDYSIIMFDLAEKLIILNNNINKNILKEIEG